VPVYILTSRRTFSAAESFTFGLRVNHRVTIVGERTGGGGHFGNFVQLPGGFYMFVPRGRTYDPETNEGWEAEGIKPDVEVSYDQALKTAIGLILERR
jgi:C-terminal processing protease CtpA/Prc